MKTKITVILCLCLFFILTPGCGERVVDKEQVSPDEKIVIKFSHVVAENTPKGLAAERYAALVKERTRGRVEVQVFPNSTLYKDGEEIQALQSGAVQMIAPATSKLAGEFPQWQIFDLPYVFMNEEKVHEAMNGYIGVKLYGGLRQNNIQSLAFWDSGFKLITNSRKPIIYPQDFNDLSFRVMINSKVLKKQFEKLGATPVEGSFDDLYRALETRAFDGEENTISNICTKNLYKVQPYLIVTNHGYMGYVVLTNAAYWNSLPPDIREVLESTMAEVTEWERQQALKMNKEGLEMVAQSGVTQVHYQTEDEKREWMEVLRPIYTEFSDVIGRDLISSIEELN
ncbi:DctP family TRAP transporter solute-binding subunit [Pelotomaculum propionicicum]|uniref:C4-dicarboxylate-binding periplasmic protein DctP n=1 Tax=Pelotomaculum propionicicum TaxID=258475 RepID=A0A4Y7RV05_9FIRM|nr:DctP family TRAP transporter solute-binding subunit [Pelotomaculum propionicicum]NLI13739.1 DctP family TRAP transporter solute-binding subunit [Peptococcaceae bacterium]TEB12532.1 C4-dicarboxylate-binding periplasmic protein DctP [Pelotomaculum propionicicum]